MDSQTSISSPDETLKLEFSLSEDGRAQYTLTYKDAPSINTSSLGFEFQDMVPLQDGLEIINTELKSINESWQQIWGEETEITNRYNELVVSLKESESPNRTFGIRFKLYNDGLGFRMEFPEQDAFPDSLYISNEQTEFALTGDHTAWWIPADYDSYEYHYKQTAVSEIDASEFKSENERPDRQIDNFQAVNTPVTMQTKNGLYLSFHEANLTDYADMTLAVTDDLKLVSELVPWADGTKVKTQAPFNTPWRTIQVGENPGALAESHLILNLNEPNKLDDTSWIEPLKYTGIWWEMHIGKSSWDLGEASEDSYGNTEVTAHGATTDNAKEYIDFNDEAKIKGFLVEGWNTGWEFWGSDSIGFFDFTTPYPDFDFEQVVKYAQDHDIAFIGHHETSGQAGPYEERLDAALELYNELGIQHLKTGYAGGIIPNGEFHHGQYMVRHYRKVVEKGSEYKIGINAHEPIKDTGIRRTYPNMMTREGVRGMEYNAWSEGLPPEHTTILPFTRGLSGPTDYTPGIFDLLFEEYSEGGRVHSTLANQLALYVVIYSPMQMVADLPENYRQDGELHPMFQFIQDVAADWDESHILDAEIGDFVITVRKERGTDRWFLGAITDEEERTKEIYLDFLEEGQAYKAIIYRDGDDADWKENPTSFEIDEQEVTRDDILELWMAPGGGTAISFERL